MEISTALSLRIRELLKQKNITQYKLEQASGLYHNTVSCLLNCKYKSANIKTVFIIIQALNMTIIEFFDSDLFKNINSFYLE